jgi:hypothetical protein
MQENAAPLNSQRALAPRTLHEYSVTGHVLLDLSAERAAELGVTLNEDDDDSMPPMERLRLVSWLAS